MDPIHFPKRLSRGFVRVGEVWKLSEKWERLEMGFKSLLFVLVGVTILLFVFWWLLPDDWRLKYAAERWADADWIDTDQVNIERKPHNCEWSSAPLGDKHCYYKAVAIRYNSHGEVITDGETTSKVLVGWERVEE
jgi:hypothetical protein